MVTSLTNDRNTPQSLKVEHATQIEKGTVVMSDTNLRTRARRAAATGGVTLMIIAAIFGLSAPTATAASGDWGHTPGANLYGCTNPSTCGPGARTVGEGWIQVWCWTDSSWQRWFKVKAWSGGAWREGWVPATQVDKQPSVPRC